jgi:hypothetical protein
MMGAGGPNPESIAVRHSVLASRGSSFVLMVVIWFLGGLLLGGLAALFLMPGLFSALVSFPFQILSSPAPTKILSSPVPSNQFSEPSLIPSLLSQPLFIFSLLLAMAPLLGAVALLVAARLQATRTLPEGKAAVGEEVAKKIEEPAAAAEKPVEEQRPVTEENGGGAAQEEGSEEGPAEQNNAAKVEEEIPEEEKETEEEEEEEEEDEKPSLGDLATLFEEDDTSLVAIEALSQGLKDIEVEQLVDITSDMSRMLRDANSSRTELFDPKAASQQVGPA